MSSIADTLGTSRLSPVRSNLLCFSAMLMWAFAFPIAEVLLESWGSITLVLARQAIGVVALIAVWIWVDGWSTVSTANWIRGIRVGGIGFGVGATSFLVGQSMSDAVTPAIAAAMMPIVGALLEVSLDGRRMNIRLLSGIALALIGGLLATGARLDEGNFGWGSLLCLISVILFAWGTRATTNEFRTLSGVGQTTITMAGSLAIVSVVYAATLLLNLPAAQVGQIDDYHLALLIFSSIASLAIAQFLWIKGASGLGILLASLHMNAVPFYVMVILVLWFSAQWNWWQASGAAVVAVGVLLAQSSLTKSL